ncbi:MAG: hypothetical protein L0Y64_19430 [Myxococcaceae bacterium]|nr:hypothetical protein [Myxococcaceae bacterium]
MRALYVWGVLVLLTVGCNDNPEAARFILGEAREADGTPWRRGALILERSLPLRDAGEWPPKEFEPYGEVPVDPDGRYAAELFAFETWFWMPYTEVIESPDGGTAEQASLFREDHVFRVRLPLDAGEAWVEAPGLGNRDSVLPPLQPWAGTLRVEDMPGGSRRVVVPAPPLRTASQYEDGIFLPSDTRLEVRSDAGVLWRVDAADPEPSEDGGVRERPLELELFPELVEGNAAVSALGVREASGYWETGDLLNVGGNRFNSYLATPPLALELPAGPVPVSRGAICVQSDDRECSLTNGLVEELPPAGGGFPDLASPLLLGRPVQVRVLVLRNVTMVGLELRAVGRTAEGEEVELARWDVRGRISGAFRLTPLYLRASVPAELPAVVRVELQAAGEVHWPGMPPEAPGSPPIVHSVGELSVFE